MLLYILIGLVLDFGCARAGKFFGINLPWRMAHTLILVLLWPAMLLAAMFLVIKRGLYDK